LSMATRNRIKFSERQAALIWQQVVGKELAGGEREHMTVIYPGRMGGDNGPDFRDVVIMHGSHLTKGDVEIHVRSSDWYSHEHQADAAYDNVILHAVLWHDSSAATLARSGKTIPVLCLTEALHHQPYLLPPSLACFRILDRMGGQNLSKLLAAAGQERFREKARRFRDEIVRPDSIGAQKEEAGQVLFRGMMRALGYARNTKPFQELADRLALSCLEARRGLATKQALLLGTAGLLPCQRKQAKFSRRSQVGKLEQIWRREGKGIESMTEHSWNFSHTYPNNSPVRRLIALSYLLERHCHRGLLDGMLQLVRRASAPAGYPLLESDLIVVGNCYWRSHFDFDLRSRTKLSALLGSSKAGEIIVNAVLPLAFCWASLAGDARLAQNAMELYRGYPGLPDNYLTRHMKNQLGLPGSLALTACHQQGLIHIFRHYCREGRCSHCPMAR
jgi:hypothetical protein